jgi:putrescine aminotransferase
MSITPLSPASQHEEAGFDVEEIVSLTRAHLNKGRASLAEILGGHSEVASEGCYVYGHDGRRYLECGGYGVFILGHRHPSVTAAVIRQIMTHPLATRVLLEPVAARAAHAVAQITPPGLEYVHFVPSGSEAAEAALKMARGAGRRRLVSAVDGFHGKTMGALSVTGRQIYQEPFAPLLPDRTHVPFGDTDAMVRVLAMAPGECCVFLEPVQGEGGVVIPPAGYLRDVREACDTYGALLVADEILTGMGRCGRMWAVDVEGVVPDIMLIGKGLSGGVVPVAAAVATADAYALINRDPLLHSSTFACSPIAMAAAESAVRAIVDEEIPARAAALGHRLLPAITQILADRCPYLVRDIRGIGLLLAVEFHAPEVAGDFMLELLDEGVVTSHSLNASRVIRMTPPACLTDADVEFLTSAVERAAASLVKIHAPATARKAV